MEREWWWLNGALNAVAQVQAERQRGSLERFRHMQAQAREVDRRRVQIAARIAEVEARVSDGEFSRVDYLREEPTARQGDGR